MADSFRQLILCPQIPEFSVASVDLLAALDQIGLTGPGIGADVDSAHGKKGQRFLVGQHFLQHISFMGCAPAIEFSPPEGGGASKITGWDQFTFVYLPAGSGHALWLADIDMARPVCPACKRRIPRSGDYIDATGALLTCPHCQNKAAVCEVDWREFGGCAKTMISIVNVYPKEAMPSENLLNQLSKRTNVAWRYFYINGSLPE